MQAIAAPFIEFRWRAQDTILRLWADARIRRAVMFMALALFGAFWGALLAVTEGAGLLLFIVAFSMVLILRDFRVGVAIMVLIMPLAQSYMFPHEMFGITGINPLNVVMATTMLVLAMRQVILDDRAPSDVLMYKALLVSCVSLVIGTLLFRRLKRGFYDYL